MKDSHPRLSCSRLLASLALSYAAVWSCNRAIPGLREVLSDDRVRDEFGSIIDNAKALLLEEYGMEYSTGPVTEEEQSWGLGGEGLTNMESSDCARMLLREFSKYPPEELYDLGIKKVRCIKNLSYQEKESFGGLSRGDTLVIEYETEKDATSQLTEDFFTNHGLHHEVWHHILWKMGIDPTDELTWSGLNVNGLSSYIGQERLDQLLVEMDSGKDLIDLTWPVGFISAYAMVNPEEDMAEMAGALIAHPYATRVHTTRDVIIYLKAERIKELFFAWSNGKMDRGYWDDLDMGWVKDGYWDNK